MHLKTLRFATDALLHEEDRGMIYLSLKCIHSVFSELSTVKGDILEQHHDKESFLDSGVAISPHLAARCLFDPLRTVQFLRGINHAIHEVMDRFPGERINIVYAGCGPYATLLLPLTTQFEPGQIRLTLIDIHKPSIDGVNLIIKALGLEDYVDACIQADAVRYTYPEDIPLHMVVSETMQAGLAREPQLAIMRNFLPQLHGNGLFIPEKITVDAYLSSSETEDIGLLMHRDASGYPVGHEFKPQANRLWLRRVVEVNSKSPQQQIFNQKSDLVALTNIEIPPHDQKFDQFLLLTTIGIFGSYNLEPYDCELSFPLRLHDLNGISSGSKIQFFYQSSHVPGLSYERISA